ncbi:hypothetical protein [Haliovirga abyssi]|uniref:Tetratricopeptide repeat protein n=1 Tax=Haliovirga abyssi TaxID=2996794 RepID=A0AAU9DUF9_9FUSO|nr:hypothetical protein [Haliovirga abyssi]BDU49591.1 hypothetical protein HLVA_01600 [Haliovirga abyssi]
MRKIKKTFIIVLLLLCNSFYLLANVTDVSNMKKLEKELKEGKKLEVEKELIEKYNLKEEEAYITILNLSEKIKDYTTEIYYAKKILEKNEKFYLMWFKLGKLYFENNDFENSKIIFKNLITKDKKVDKILVSKSKNYLMKIKKIENKIKNEVETWNFKIKTGYENINKIELLSMDSYEKMYGTFRGSHLMDEAVIIGAYSNYRKKIAEIAEINFKIGYEKLSYSLDDNYNVEIPELSLKLLLNLIDTKKIHLKLPLNYEFKQGYAKISDIKLEGEYKITSNVSLENSLGYIQKSSSINELNNKFDEIKLKYSGNIIKKIEILYKYSVEKEKEISKLNKSDIFGLNISKQVYLGFNLDYSMNMKNKIFGERDISVDMKRVDKILDTKLLLSKTFCDLEIKLEYDYMKINSNISKYSYAGDGFGIIMGYNF